MSACLHCGVLLPPGTRICDRCGAPRPPSWSDPRQVPEPSAQDLPDGWVESRDRWRGFRVFHPRAFRLLRRGGPILVTPDEGRRFAALLWPGGGCRPEEAGALATRLVQWKIQQNPGARVYVPPGSPAVPTRLRILEEGAGEVLETRVEVRSDARAALLVGLQAPQGSDRALWGVLGRIGASFAPVPALSRVLWIEPVEGAFVVEVPAGWVARGGVRRHAPTGPGTTWFEAWGEPTGRLRVTLSGQVEVFLDPGPSAGLGALAGLFVGVPPWTAGLPAGRTLAYQTAESYVRQRLFPERRRVDPKATLLGGEDRPDLVASALAELAGQGVPGARVSVGEYQLGWASPGGPVLEKGRVQTLQVVVPSLMPGTPQPWMAETPRILQAPQESSAAWEAVLEGVAESCQVNPHWQTCQQAAVQGHMAASQADRHRRLGEISRTLSETSDRVVAGYWERSAVTERVGHDWSNAFRGYEDRVSASGEVFNLPSGYDRVFRDPQGNFLGGGWLLDPDPGWQELRLQ